MKAAIYLSVLMCSLAVSAGAVRPSLRFKRGCKTFCDYKEYYINPAGDCYCIKRSRQMGDDILGCLDFCKPGRLYLAPDGLCHCLGEYMSAW
ncbi:hypothetical protein BDB01DRAFT_808982 [Pilobolus umbonatus]|nr:hypothetical protein BDB01DRAFT_808982 [Pilobolus umbonatus]